MLYLKGFAFFEELIEVDGQQSSKTVLRRPCLASCMFHTELHDR